MEKVLKWHFFDFKRKSYIDVRTKPFFCGPHAMSLIIKDYWQPLQKLSVSTIVALDGGATISTTMPRRYSLILS
jgi:hypothetical protein